MGVNIQELNKELSKHRKLLNRAVGDKILPSINYHHYEIVRLIGEIKSEEGTLFSMDLTTIRKTPFEILPFSNANGFKLMGDNFLEDLHQQTMDQEFESNITTSKDGSHNDFHISK